MIITDYLSLNANKYPNEQAIVITGPLLEKNNARTRVVLTWEDLNKRVNSIANMLISNGFKIGDRIALLLPNSFYWLPVYFAIIKAGAIVVPLNYNNGIDELEYNIKHVECAGLFYGRNYKALAEKFKNKLNFLFEIDSEAIINNEFERILYCHSTEDPNVCINGQDVAAIYFSSGTTGKAKAAVLQHSALIAAAEAEQRHHYQRQSDRFLCVSPLYHTGSFIHWLGSVLVGGAIVISKSTSPIGIINTIEAEKVSIVSLLVPQIQDILDAIYIGDICDEQRKTASLRLMYSGAQPVPKSLILQWVHHFPHVQYDTNYGLTEAAGPGCINLGIENIDKVGAIGKPDPSWEIAIVDDFGNQVPTGVVGELIVKGPGVMLGYYKDAEATNNTIRDKWLFTGDMAYIDEAGFVFLVDRKKDIIITGGENIYPVQVEGVIREVSSVKDVAVIGLPNKRWGEVVAAVVEIKPDCHCTKLDIKNACSCLPAYKRPVKIIFGKVIRNACGKIDKKRLISYYSVIT